MMRALVNGSELHITDRGSAYYRRLPVEQKTATLSGAQYTRKGRESQIYVLQKIAAMLKERGMLDEYRRSLTMALAQFRLLCKEDFPDLSDRCTDLIRQYGEPGPVRAFRSADRLFRVAARRGRKRVRRYLKHAASAWQRKDDTQIKNVSGPGNRKSNSEYPHKTDDGIGAEVTYGWAAYKKTMPVKGGV